MSKFNNIAHVCINEAELLDIYWCTHSVEQTVNDSALEENYIYDIIFDMFSIFLKNFFEMEKIEISNEEAAKNYFVADSKRYCCVHPQSSLFIIVIYLIIILFASLFTPNRFDIFSKKGIVSESSNPSEKLMIAKIVNLSKSSVYMISSLVMTNITPKNLEKEFSCDINTTFYQNSELFKFYHSSIRKINLMQEYLKNHYVEVPLIDEPSINFDSAISTIKINSDLNPIQTMEHRWYVQNNVFSIVDSVIRLCLAISFLEDIVHFIYLINSLRAEEILTLILAAFSFLYVNPFCFLEFYHPSLRSILFNQACEYLYYGYVAFYISSLFAQFKTDTKIVNIIIGVFCWIAIPSFLFIFQHLTSQIPAIFKPQSYQMNILILGSVIELILFGTSLSICKSSLRYYNYRNIVMFFSVTLELFLISRTFCPCLQTAFNSFFPVLLFAVFSKMMVYFHQRVSRSDKEYYQNVSMANVSSDGALDAEVDDDQLVRFRFS